jgi:predicted nucleic acid-binding protein
MTYLLDTNVISERQKRRPDPQVTAWFQQARGERLYLSALSLGELYRWVRAIQGRDVAAALTLRSWLSELEARFARQILPVTTEIAREWGRLDAPDRRLPVVDGLLAATARVHGLAVVTRNVKDFERAGVTVLNPFSA